MQQTPKEGDAEESSEKQVANGCTSAPGVDISVVSEAPPKYCDDKSNNNADDESMVSEDEMFKLLQTDMEEHETSPGFDVEKALPNTVDLMQADKEPTNFTKALSQEPLKNEAGSNVIQPADKNDSLMYCSDSNETQNSEIAHILPMNPVILGQNQDQHQGVAFGPDAAEVQQDELETLELTTTTVGNKRSGAVAVNCDLTGDDKSGRDDAEIKHVKNDSESPCLMMESDKCHVDGLICEQDANTSDKKEDVPVLFHHVYTSAKEKHGNRVQNSEEQNLEIEAEENELCLALDVSTEDSDLPS